MAEYDYNQQQGGYPPQQPYQQQYQQPQQQPYQQQPYQQQYQQPQQYGVAPAKSATTLIVLSVVEIILWGGLFGIIPLVFAVQANSAYSAGDIVTGDAKSKNAKTALIAVAIAMLALFAIVIAGSFMAASSYA